MVAFDLGTGGEFSSSTHCDGGGAGDIFAQVTESGARNSAKFKSPCCVVFDVVGDVGVVELLTITEYNLVGVQVACCACSKDQANTTPEMQLRGPDNLDLPQFPE